MARTPHAKETARNGSSTRKMVRQPHVCTMAPPTEGPTAGAVAVMSVATPIMRPMRLSGACSMMMLNMSGSARPVPRPCTTRPAMSIQNAGAAAHSTVPAAKSAMAATNSVFVRKRRLKNDDSGTTQASTSRYPVVIHCTLAVSTENSAISVGNVMFMAVSTTTPANDMMPQATTDRMRRASTRRSKAPGAGAPAGTGAAAAPSVGLTTSVAALAGCWFLLKDMQGFLPRVSSLPHRRQHGRPREGAPPLVTQTADASPRFHRWAQNHPHAGAAGRLPAKPHAAQNGQEKTPLGISSRPFVTACPIARPPYLPMYSLAASSAMRPELMAHEAQEPAAMPAS